MLTEAENQRLTRVGPGTPMGTLFRRYWIPALLSEELPEPDGAPVRVRLLGEDLVAFRDSTGTVGLVSAYCPHRRAPMFFGRNEECGLRCVYHGWKFDRDGACVDMPSEPPDSLFKTKVKIEAYPTWEGGSIVWAYLGPAELQPEPPAHELVRTPATHRHVSKSFEDCNFLQALEGGIDPTHASIMHNGNIGDRSFLNRYDELVANIQLDKTDYGFTYAGIRTLTKATWVRGYHYIMPSFHMRATVEGPFGNRSDGPTIDGHIWVPIDDEQTWVFSFGYSHDPARPLDHERVRARETRLGRGDNLEPGYRPRQNKSNDYGIDRQRQKTESMTGIPGINTQDFALQEGMGPICDRSQEHLGTTDRAIITLRQVLFAALDTLDSGGRPPAIDPATYRNVRSFDRLVQPDTEWRSATKADAVTRF
ncbi:MAG: Rieske 2Fe-2S domain-containing protein [Candidatus Lustribacter sp.]|jgi:phenylpropionate dioxygenase-like ring-hydroxylating dioxygenase large terminal subunit